MSVHVEIRTLPGTKEDTTVAEQPVSELIPRYHVILLDDDHHTYEYVIEMLMDIFGHSRGLSYQMACSVDANGSVVVLTTHKEHAEMKRDQIHGYGADWRIPRCQGSMSAVVEPAE